MTNISLKGRRIYVSSTDAIANINWLLDHGARVTVVGMRDDSADITRRIEEHLKRTAADGKAFALARARLVWSSDSATPLSDLQQLFCSLWKKKIIGITGKHGKTTTAVWAAHIIGDAVAAGILPERPLLPALDSRARVVVVKLPEAAPMTSGMLVVNTDTLSNTDAAIEAAHLAGVPQRLIAQRVGTLPQVPFRQEVVQRSPKLVVINDAMATQPARGIAALRQWGGPTCALICGGDDAQSNYDAWAQELLKQVRCTNLILLTGSATKKMRVALGAHGRGIRAYDSLAAALKAARSRAALYVSSVILFSPAAQCDTSFADAYDRGKQFNELVRRFS